MAVVGGDTLTATATASASASAMAHGEDTTQEMSLQNGLSQKETMADVPRARHYPLDLPELPLSQYEHRSLTARDILVHRIMSKIMSPAPGRATPSVFASYAINPEDWAYYASIKAEDNELGADLQLLRKMLYTTSVKEPPMTPLQGPVPSTARYSPEVKENLKRLGFPIWKMEDVPMHGPRTAPATLEELALDLIQRYYLEDDDPWMRLYLQSRRPPPRALPSAGPDAEREARLASFARLLWDTYSKVGTPSEGKEWWDEDIKHLRSLQRNAHTARANLLFDGGVFLPTLRQSIFGEPHARFPFKLYSVFRRADIEMTMFCLLNDYTRWMFSPIWKHRLRAKHGLDDVLSTPREFSLGRTGRGLDRDGYWSSAYLRDDQETGCTSRGFRRRATSEPPPGAFTSARLSSYDPTDLSAQLDLVFPKMSLATMDRRSRRRSLSRTRIAEMFNWNTRQSVPPINITTTPCANCLAKTHITSDCTSACGYCGAPSPATLGHFLNAYISGNHAGEHKNPHLAPQCPVAPHNRCKCGPFPMYHTAAKCPVTCSRPCGNPHPPGSFKHRNAMGCEMRCCMCGILGHSGSQCKLKKCRCGGHHLGQDCGWKPECRVVGCTRYLCGIHCVRCGREKGKGGLIEGHCEDCAQSRSESSTPSGVGEAEAEGRRFTGRGRRRRKRQEKPAEQQLMEKEKKQKAKEAYDNGPSWLPLRPRVNPKTKK